MPHDRGACIVRADRLPRRKQGPPSRDFTGKPLVKRLAPVADLNLRSMLAGAPEPVAAPMPELDTVFARVARESDGIQDVDGIGLSLAGAS